MIAAAVVVGLLALFWKPSVTYLASVYREPNYVQEPYYIQSTANCGSLWQAATGGLSKFTAPQNPPPAGESEDQYLALYTGYADSVHAHAVCGSQAGKHRLDSRCRRHRGCHIRGNAPSQAGQGSADPRRFIPTTISLSTCRR